MQKKKYLSQKISGKKINFLKSKISSKTNKFKFKKRTFFLTKILKYKPYGRKNFNRINSSEIFSHRLTIRVTQNNIFCSLTKNDINLTLNSCSSGKYKIKTSKKKLKHTFDLVLANFFSEINKKHDYTGLFILITSPIKIRKKIINASFFNFKKKPLLIKVLKKKSFNGCRPPKKIRKKRHGLRLFK